MSNERVKKYGQLAKKRKMVRAVSLGVTGPERRRVIMAAAERVIATHIDVIKALAKR